MMAKSHVPFAIVSWIGWCGLTEQDPSLLTCSIAGFAGLLPDIDHPNSVLGQKLPMISYPIAKIFGHRGITHSFFMTALLTYALYSLSHSQNMPVISDIALMPLIIGYLSHLVGDFLTPSGVPLFWPYKRTFSLGLFKTDSWLETIFVYALVGLTLLLSPLSHDMQQILAEKPDQIFQKLLSFLDPRLSN